MKNIRFKFIGVLILVVLVLGSCKKWIDTGINVNPDAPTDVPMKSLLPAIESNMAYNTVGGNDGPRLTSIWMQYFQGIARQSQGSANYIWKDGDVDNQWLTNYAQVMMDLTQLTAKAKKANDPTYWGIANVLMAEALGKTTDVWGDVPFSDAFQGLTKLQPKFDTQQEIYATINNLLDEAITKLGEATLSAEGDLMYGGDPAMWLKAAHGMKARYTLHLSKRDNTAFANALAALEGSLASNDDDLQFPFAVGVGSQNPLFQFMDQRGDVTMHKTFMDMLKQRFDPRIPMFATAGADPNDPYQGADWTGSFDNASLPGTAVAAEDAPVLFLTYAECMFIKAECEFNTGVAETQIRADIIEGVSASFNKWGVFNAAYIAAYDSVLQTMSGGALYHEIMTQKYIALYHQSESFVDWRRTENIIGLQPNPTSAAQLPPSGVAEIPRRYPYSLNEKSYNPDHTPKNVDIWQRVWWDAAPGKK